MSGSDVYVNTRCVCAANANNMPLDNAVKSVTSERPGGTDADSLWILLRVLIKLKYQNKKNMHLYNLTATVNHPITLA